MYRNLTIHIVNSVPWSNLNRDDTGTPKRLLQGGVLRGQLSSQSIKRAARTDYEEKSLDASVRSGNLPELVAERAAVLNPAGDQKAFLREARALIGKLTKEGGEENEAARSTWLSAEEIESAARRIAGGSESEFVQAWRTGSLAIAAFGRMFANDSSKGTESAVSISPAVSTHRAVIENDYFSAVDDHASESQGKGATFLGISQYTNGVFYRTATIDREQLAESWTGLDRDDSRKSLETFVTSLIYKLPRGKEHGTALYVMPAVVLCEEQAYRMAYDFETPVQADEANGGFLGATVQSLLEQRTAALRFDPDNFGSAVAIGGTAEGLERFGVPVTTRQGLVDLVVNWILQ